VVADRDNFRVLIWKTFPTVNGAPADLVVGHDDLTGNASTGTFQLSEPISVSSNGNQLFVAEGYDSRVLVWNTFPATNGTAPDVVLGQGDFSHSTRNDDNQDRVPDAAPTARTLADPHSVALWGNQLVVTDRSNHRYLFFDAQ
jgi:hypothetical protein